MGSNAFLSVYPYSFSEAKRLNELDRWKESHKENVACKNAIEEAIRRDFDGMHLQKECATGIIAQFGYHRTAYVLANSLQQKDYDGRFSNGNHHWAKSIFVPSGRDAYSNRNADFTVDSHPAVLDGFVNQFRRAYQALGMFDRTHCQPDTAKQDFEGKVIVLSADVLNERSLAPENQLWLCTGGFGSHAGASGRGVFATCLFDGEKTRWNREDFVGVLADSQFPDWAREKLQELRTQEQSEAPAPEMGGHDHAVRRNQWNTGDGNTGRLASRDSKRRAIKMQGITLNNGLIAYYGNPAGYIEKNAAVVDRIFENEELTSWLQSRGLTPKWTDGVMERLAAGERLGESAETSAPPKNVRIWQLRPETDVYMKFISFDEMAKKFGEPNPEHYRIAYDGQLGTNDLESIFSLCNVSHPPGYNGHSLSMSDVVELYDSTGSEYHYCDRFGFKQITFKEAPQTLGMAESMSQSF